ncbi:MAG: class II aldolase/adducin family protein [Thermoanaerobaculales bacterium]
MPMWLEARRRAEIVAVGAALSRQGLVRNREGNISCRLGDGHVLITPRGTDKGRLVAADLILVEFAAPLPSAASSEASLHLETYRLCPDLVALVHAHPPHVLALDGVGALPDAAGMPEAEALLGRVGRVPLFPPASAELALACARVLRRTPVAVLARHGLVAGGADLWQALSRIEVAELASQVALARRTGSRL